MEKIIAEKIPQLFYQLMNLHLKKIYSKYFSTIHTDVPLAPDQYVIEMGNSICQLNTAENQN